MGHGHGRPILNEAISGTESLFPIPICPPAAAMALGARVPSRMGRGRESSEAANSEALARIQSALNAATTITDSKRVGSRQSP